MSGNASDLLRRVLLSRYAGALIGLIGVSAYLTATEPVFLTWDNVTNIVRAQTVLAILAVGMTFVVLTAGIDLSVAAMTAVAAMILGLTIEAEWPWALAALATIGVATVLGLANGFLIGVARISFFVVTLGTLSIFTSIALLSNSGETISLFGSVAFAPIRDLVNDSVGPFPVLLIAVAVLYVIGAFVLRYTAFGRATYAVGSNPEAARLAGINVVGVLVAVYVISGACAGLAAIVQAGRLTAASPQVDPTLLLTVIAAVLIGGTSYTGGVGGLLGTLIGVLFLGVIQNGLSLADVSTFWQGMVSGLILIIAVGLGVLREHGWELRLRRGAGARRAAGGVAALVEAPEAPATDGEPTEGG